MSPVTLYTLQLSLTYENSRKVLLDIVLIGIRINCNWQKAQINGDLREKSISLFTKVHGWCDALQGKGPRILLYYCSTFCGLQWSKDYNDWRCQSIFSYEIPHSRHPEGRNEENDIHFSLKTQWEAVHHGALEFLHILLKCIKITKSWSFFYLEKGSLLSIVYTTGNPENWCNTSQYVSHSPAKHPVFLQAEQACLLLPVKMVDFLYSGIQASALKAHSHMQALPGSLYPLVRFEGNWYNWTPTAFALRNSLWPRRLCLFPATMALHQTNLLACTVLLVRVLLLTVLHTIRLIYVGKSSDK